MELNSKLDRKPKESSMGSVIESVYGARQRT